MPLGPGGLDSNGIWLYGEDDSEALASDLLNLGMQSVSDAIESFGGAGILQVVSTTKTDTFSTSNTSFTGITGLTASITPSSTSSKVFCVVTIGSVDASQVADLQLRLARGGTAIGVGDAAGSRTRVGIYLINAAANRPQSSSYSFLDSPSSTSSQSYAVEARIPAGTMHINRSDSDTDASGYGRSVSTITLMEVAG